MIKEEWKKIWNKKFLIIVLVAVMLVPTIYTTVFLGSMWDPYGNLSKLPVAVVNKDRAVEYEEKTLKIGADLVENLSENDSLQFHFVEEEVAEAGLSDGTYYMVLTIPENFSANAATLMEDEPLQMELSYQTNPGTNFIASKMSESAMEKIKSSISEEVTKTYAESVFDKIATIGDGMEEAADGAGTLEEGMGEILTGSNTLTDNLLVLENSTNTFVNGTSTLKDGILDYTSGVNKVKEGTETLTSGVNTLAAKDGKLTSGLNQIDTGMESLTNGLTSYTQGVGALSDGADQLTGNSNSLVEGVETVSAGTAQLEMASTSLLTGLENLSAEISDTLSEEKKQQLAGISGGMTTLNTDIQQLNETMQAVTAIESTDPAVLELQEQVRQMQVSMGQIAATANVVLPSGSSSISSLQAGLTNVDTVLDQKGTTPETMGIIQVTEQINGGAAKLQTGITDEKAGLLTGVKSYTAGVGTLQQGLASLEQNSSNLVTGAQTLDTGFSSLQSQLTDGLTQLQSGATALQSGTQELDANSGTLNSGASKLEEGAVAINEGAGKLADGSNTLTEGVEEASAGTTTLYESLDAGAAEIKEGQADDETIGMFAAPVVTEKTEMTSVENNGSAMAAYMMCVGLWVAGLALCIAYPMQHKKKDNQTGNGLRIWAGKASVFLPVAILQAIVMVGMLGTINGFQPAELGKTILAAVITSVAFMSMIVFANVSFGVVGSFLLLVFMVLQLAGCAGTYPIAISGEFVAGINRFMPFTYAVNSFRSTIAGGEAILGDLLILIAITVVFSLLTMLVYHWKSAKREEKEAQESFETELLEA